MGKADRRRSLKTRQRMRLRKYKERAKRRREGFEKPGQPGAGGAAPKAEPKAEPKADEAP